MQNLDIISISFYLGIAIILFCILALLFPFGQRFKQGTQKIRGLGLELEVSVMTLVFLIGFTLTFSGIWLQLQKINEQLKKLEADKNKAEANAEHYRYQYEQAKSSRYVTDVTLNEVGGEFPKVEDLEGRYYLVQDGNGPIEISPGTGGDGTIRLTINDLNRLSAIRRLVLRERGTNREWVLDKIFYPFQVPALEMTLKK